MDEAGWMVAGNGLVGLLLGQIFLHESDRAGTFADSGSDSLDRPQPGYEFYGFMKPANVYPSEFVLIESIWATLRLVAASRGITIQPRLALEPAFEGTVVVPLDDVSIRVRWEAVARPDRGPDTETLLQAMVGAVAH